MNFFTVYSLEFRICHESSKGTFGVSAARLEVTLDALVDAMTHKVEERIEMRTNATQDEDFDQEALELIEESEEMGEELLTNLMDAVGYIIKSKGQAIMHSFEKTIHPFATNLLRPEAPPSPGRASTSRLAQRRRWPPTWGAGVAPPRPTTPASSRWRCASGAATWTWAPSACSHIRCC